VLTVAERRFFAFYHLVFSTSSEFRRTLMEQVYLAMRDTISIPENDRFATITELEPGNFNNSGNYADIERSENVVFIQITLNKGRTVEKKKALYADIAKRLSADPGRLVIR